MDPSFHQVSQVLFMVYIIQYKGVCSCNGCFGSKSRQKTTRKGVQVRRTLAVLIGVTLDSENCQKQRQMVSPQESHCWQRSLADMQYSDVLMRGANPDNPYALD